MLGLFSQSNGLIITAWPLDLEEGTIYGFVSRIALGVLAFALVYRFILICVKYCRAWHIASGQALRPQRKLISWTLYYIICRLLSLVKDKVPFVASETLAVVAAIRCL